MERLRRYIRSIDGASYKAYKGIHGTFRFPDYLLEVSHIQGDPFAAPSRFLVKVPMEEACFPEDYRMVPQRRLALEDFVGRSLNRAIGEHVKGSRGSGRSGEVAVAVSGQKILRRNAVLVDDFAVEARITVALPARGRRIAGDEATAIFFQELPRVVAASLLYRNLPQDSLKQHIRSVENQDFLRQQLVPYGLVAFLANGARLPRASGVDDGPMGEGVRALHAPASMEVTLELPRGGTLRGMGIKKGVTLIVGGGYHGKSTLLQAIMNGVYNHVPGDGREQVVALPNAVKVKAEEGRAIAGLNISAFIDNLPGGRDTRRFHSANASGSTSQAANIIEALQAGSRLLLLDEDTSAANFMIRDERMRSLVRGDKEPITPFLNHVQSLYEEHEVSTILVMGGSGDYFQVADQVIMMDAYRPTDVTRQARDLARGLRLDRRSLPPGHLQSVRRPDGEVLDPSRGNRKVRFEVRDVRIFNYGMHRIDMSSAEQLVDPGQSRAIMWMMAWYYENFGDLPADLLTNLQTLLEMAEAGGLDRFTPYTIGDLAMPRLQELVATVTRIREGTWSELG